MVRFACKVSVRRGAQGDADSEMHACKTALDAGGRQTRKRERMLRADITSGTDCDQKVPKEPNVSSLTRRSKTRTHVISPCRHLEHAAGPADIQTPARIAERITSMKRYVDALRRGTAAAASRLREAPPFSRPPTYKAAAE